LVVAPAASLRPSAERKGVPEGSGPGPSAQAVMVRAVGPRELLGAQHKGSRGRAMPTLATIGPSRRWGTRVLRVRQEFVISVGSLRGRGDLLILRGRGNGGACRRLC